ncbi:CoB--CoM heterodisulfide reductase [Desulfonema ishimotonii]|uniref:CoB--CoM heterodisulfide reductase n=1 Tax=Desulfonema ishimotonii TaxID=45657 RepID=A0A401G149_9BACT|nr:CoB--CoM heterodisulfide reductase iron-sulfur subunit B family protein [Desulfonema ishimotonii]GBC62913.1 CoB--CoM heterodisulfide reductase [Desulfonema ishimotonii]
MEIGYYPGCSLKQSSALYDLQSRRIFAELGVQLTEIEDWNCCGATSAGKLDDFMAVAMPARNIGIAETQGFSEVVIPCSACYSRTLVAQKRLEASPLLRAEINENLSRKLNGGVRISSILEVLIDRISAGELKPKIRHKFRSLKPVCYYGCMQTRFPFDVPVPDDVENPQGMETVLKAVGVRAIDWGYKTACCGASAAVNDPETSFNLMAKIMKEAVARGANCFVTTCPMCQLNLDAHQEKFCQKHGIAERLPVFFITEILGATMGISPEALQVDRHFVDGTTLLKELEQDESKQAK